MSCSFRKSPCWKAASNCTKSSVWRLCAVMSPYHVSISILFRWACRIAKDYNKKLSIIKCTLFYFKCLCRFFMTTITSTFLPQTMIGVRNGWQLSKRVSSSESYTSDPQITGYPWFEIVTFITSMFRPHRFFHSAWYRDKVQQLGCEIPPKLLDGW